MDLTIKLAAIAAIGILAQWVAWRTGWPAIALMLAGGIIAGPITGFIDPAVDFGTLYQPAIKLAVAIILFEGGLSLDFRELRHAGWPVGRLVLIGAPVAWILGAYAGHYAAGLPIEIAVLFGGILVVTGPTVVGPMLRQLRIGARPRDVLKWEGIVNDPLGALLAVLTLAYISYSGESGSAFRDIGIHVGLASLLAIGIGVGLAMLIGWAFPRGHVPEFLKVPVTFALVIVGFVVADVIEHETGLLTVTAMGIVLANMHLDSLGEMRRFKESVTILLISGVFVILSATLDWQTISRFEFRFILFLILLLFVVRPASVLIALLFSKMPWKERLFLAWIAPRGVVCVAITGLFALRLEELGFAEAPSLVTLAFAVVIVTILAHGFTARMLARRLGLDQGPGRAVLIVGSTPWSIKFAEALERLDIETLIADTSFLALRHARRAGVDTYHGDILESVHNDYIDISAYQAVIAATDTDAYNALILNELGPEIGHNAIFRLGTQTGKSTVTAPLAQKGRVLLKSKASLLDLLAREDKGWIFKQTRISEKYTLSDLKARLDDDAEIFAVIKPSKRILFFASVAKPVLESGDHVLAYIPPENDDKATMPA